MANPFDQFDSPATNSAANPFDQFDAPKAKPESSGIAQGAGNLIAGLVRGAGSIGSTILAPYDMAKDAIAGKGLSLESNRQRRADIDAGLQTMGAEPDSMLYQGGKLAGEIAGTAGAPGIIAKGAQAVGAAPKIVNAIASSGFKTGAPAATTAAEAIQNAAIRTGGAAVAGGAAAGAVNPEDATSGAMIGAALPGAVKVSGEIGKGIKGAITNALGATTGTSAETVKAAFDAGKAGSREFLDHMRGNAEFDDVIASAKEGLGRMRQARADQYRSGMIDISNDKTVLDFKPIDDAMNRVLTIGNYKGVPINKNASGTVNDIAETIQQWKMLPKSEYHTPEGLDALKQSIGDIRDSTQFGTPARKAADAIYNAIKKEISAQAPTYDRVMKDYAQASSTLDEVTRALSLGDKVSKDTAIRKLQSLMRNNAQTNYGNRLSLASELEQQGGVSLRPALAGQSMNTWTPRGMTGAIEKGAIGVGSVLNPAVLAAAPAASPRMVGESAYALGRGTGAAGNAVNAIGQSSRNALGNNSIDTLKRILDGSLRVSPVIGLASQSVQQ